MAKKPQILEITEATAGGVRRHLLDLVRYLDHDRFSVSLVCSTSRNPGFADDIRTLRSRGIEVTVIPMTRSINPVRDLFALAALVRHLRKCPPGLVHTHSSKAGFLGRLAARIVGISRVVHTAHVFPFQMKVSRARRQWYYRLERMMVKDTHRFICVSDAEKNDVVEWGLCERGALTTVKNGVEMPDDVEKSRDAAVVREEVGFSKDDVLVGSVGRYTRQKGYATLVEALPEILRRVPRAKVLLVAEDGETRAQLQRMVDRRGLSYHCRLLGPRRHPLDVYLSLDVFVLPSLWEGLSYSLLEAMAVRKAVVATDVGGTREAIRHGENGLLVPPAESGALAEAIVTVAKDPALRARLGACAEATVEREFRVERMVRETERVYKECLDIDLQKD